MAQVTIRHASPADAATIRTIARGSWHAAYDSVLGAEAVDETVDEWYDLERLRESIADTRERDDGAVLVAERADSRNADGEGAGADPEAVGFVHVVPNRSDSDVAELLRIYVRPDAWGDGVGTALLEAAERELRDEFERCRLIVLADNEVGVSFYESRGFGRVETRESDLGDGLEEYVYEREW